MNLHRVQNPARQLGDQLVEKVKGAKMRDPAWDLLVLRAMLVWLFLRASAGWLLLSGKRALHLGVLRTRLALLIFQRRRLERCMRDLGMEIE